MLDFINKFLLIRDFAEKLKMETELMKISHIKYLEKKIVSLKNKLKNAEILMGHQEAKIQEIVKKITSFFIDFVFRARNLIFLQNTLAKLKNQPKII